MRLNAAVRQTARTHEGGAAVAVRPEQELRRAVLTCLLWENSFYEKGSELAKRIAALVAVVDPEAVAALAVEARSVMQLRHVPLFLMRELVRRKSCGRIVAATLETVIQRPDELTELLAMYWKEGRKPLAAGIKRGLAAAFRKFSAYQLAKYNRADAVKLRDVLFLVHAKPKDAEQAATWKQLVDVTLPAPDTWEVALSAGADKKETWERLLREEKLGGMAVLRNLKNMQSVGVDEALIRARLAQGIGRALPFRFVVAARHAPQLEDALEAAMLKGVEALAVLPGETGLLIDVSGSMDGTLSDKSEMTRLDAAAALAIYLREKAERVRVATFSQALAEIPPRRGFALRDAVVGSQPHGSTYLRGALAHLKRGAWANIDRIVVVTDEQSHDGIEPCWIERGYVINVAGYQHGVGYTSGWLHISGWSEAVVEYVRQTESDADVAQTARAVAS